MAKQQKPKVKTTEVSSVRANGKKPKQNPKVAPRRLTGRTVKGLSEAAIERRRRRRITLEPTAPIFKRGRTTLEIALQEAKAKLKVE